MLFISYSTKDRAVASENYNRLTARAYHALFLDHHPDAGIRGGSEWKKELSWQLKVAGDLIILASEIWRLSDWRRDELGAAKALSKTMILLNIEGCTLPGTMAAPQQIDF